MAKNFIFQFSVLLLLLPYFLPSFPILGFHIRNELLLRYDYDIEE
jgi:hypothetical protein